VGPVERAAVSPIRAIDLSHLQIGSQSQGFLECCSAPIGGDVSFRVIT